MWATMSDLFLSLNRKLFLSIIKIMKTFYRSWIALFAITGVFLLNTFNVTAQNINSKKLHETIDDANLPAAAGQMIRTPAYRYENSMVFTQQVNVDENGDNIVGDAANEPSIAVDPVNPDRIVIGWRQFDNVSSNFRQAGYGYTSDGGHTWTFPGVIDPGQFRSDPVLDFDTLGNFYYNSLGVDNGDNMWCDVYRITDGGFEWDEGVYAEGGDKQWMRIDRTDGIGSGNIYAEWNQSFSVCNNGSFTRSTDNGDSYEDCFPVDGNPFWGTLAVGPEGELYETGVTYDYPSGVVVVKSNNAKVPGSDIEWDMKTWVKLDGYLSGWTNINPVGLLGQAWVDVDKSDGPGHGYVYVLAAVERKSFYDPGDIMFARSTDGGLTWDDPVRVNDDLSFTNIQWMGTMSVAPDGRIDVVWLDTRDAPSNTPDYSALYYAYSTDHGVSWSANEKISELFNPHVGYPNQQKMGDYFDMVSDANGAHLAWANTLNNEEDVYYTHITPPVVTGVENSNKTEVSFNLRNYPNPFNTQTSILYYLPETMHVNLTLYDSYGRMVKVLDNQTGVKGSHNVAVSVIDLEAGIYYARLTAGNTTETTKLVVVK
jgi:hypothetical protein